MSTSEIQIGLGNQHTQKIQFLPALLSFDSLYDVCTLGTTLIIHIFMALKWSKAPLISIFFIVTLNQMIMCNIKELLPTLQLYRASEPLLAHCF